MDLEIYKQLIMEYFTGPEQGKLKKILFNSSHLRLPDNRINFMEVCGLERYSSEIQPDKNFDNFFTSLVAVLCKNNVKKRGEEKLALVIFLETFLHLEDNLSTEDKDSIEHFIQKCQTKKMKKIKEFARIGACQHLQNKMNTYFLDGRSLYSS